MGIDANNCPDEKLKHFLLEIVNVIEGNSEKIVNQTQKYIDRKQVDNPTNPEDMEKLMRIFSSIQKPMDDKREQAKFYEGKNYFEIEYEKKFKKGSIKQGERAFNQLTETASNFHNNFNFYQTSSSGDDDDSPSSTLPNFDEIIQDIKTNPQN